MTPFNGLTPSRQDLGANRAPDYEDYLALVKEIAETQVFVINLSQNLTAMPSLDGALRAAMDKIEAVKAKVEAITPPAELIARLNEQDKQLVAIDCRQQLTKLMWNLETTKVDVHKSKQEVEKLNETFLLEVKSFQNKMWVALNEFQEEMKSQLDSMEARVDNISTLAEMQNLLTKLKG
jgi:hypothetical protein